MRVKVKTVKYCGDEPVFCENLGIFESIFEENSLGAIWKEWYRRGEMQGNATSTTDDFDTVKIYLEYRDQAAKRANCLSRKEVDNKSNSSVAPRKIIRRKVKRV